ncbi:MAG: ABC transporter permease, partial [Bacteroidetes bacterium]|nr:ABC transporter permease [Bacteroidota bacterium]
MFRNYFITTYRNLKRNWSYTLINVLGLGLAMACCIVAFLINAVNFNFDRDYEDIDQLYQVHARRVVGQDQQIWGITPLPLSGAIASEFPEVELSARIGGSSHLFVYEGQTFDQYV